MPWCSEFDQFTDATTRPVPLFPVAHPNATPEPMIHFNRVIILQGNAKVVHPALDVGTDVSVPPWYRDTPTAAGEMTQLGLKPCEGFLPLMPGVRQLDIICMV